jgi:hypothetical protein
MPRTCSRCGAQNGEDNAFCQQCGAPLAAPDASAPVQPLVPPTQPPPIQPPPVYQQPAPPVYQQPAPPVYQQPAPPVQPPPVYQPVAPAHRLPLATMLGSVAGVLGLLAAGAIVFGHTSPGPTPLPVPTTQPQPTSAPVQPTTPPQPTAQSQPTTQAQPTTQSQPTAPDVATDTPVAVDTPAAVDTPVAVSPPNEPTQPAPGPGPGPAPGGQAVTTSLFSVVVPSGWQAKQSGTEVQLQDPSTAPNSLDIAGGTPNSPVTVDAALQGLLAQLQKNAPDAQPCGQGQSLTIGGARGTVLPVCFTFTPQGGAAIKSVALLWAATSSSGSSIFVVEEIAAQDNQAFFTNAGHVTNTLRWTGGQ